jgi:response regulator RpfG family c-di-GMP phosphodiesterase
VPPPADPATAQRLLIVDDELRILTSLKATLEREGFSVVTSSSPRRGLELLEDEAFGVVIADHLMPEMTGLEFLVACQRLQPLASRVLITGAVSLPMLVEAINRSEIYRFLAKPWLREELVAAMRNAVGRYELLTQNHLLLAETAALNQDLARANATLATKVAELETQRRSLDTANTALERRYAHSLELCRRILATFDPILAGRTQAITTIVTQMCHSDHLDENERHALRTAAWLCDLGRIGVPREVLHVFRVDPTRLAAREIDSIHAHPIYSQTLVSHLDERPLVGETVRAHHERFDGSGYPDGHAGQAIPWTARCLAVAVCYVECGLPREQALSLLSSESGTGLDPEALRLFLQTTRLSPLPTACVRS